MWQISPNGKYHYLDKYYGGKTTDEKDIRLYGVIDSNCRVVEKLRITIKDRKSEEKDSSQYLKLLK